MKLRFSLLAPSAPLLKGRHFVQRVNSSLSLLSGKNNARSLFSYDCSAFGFLSLNETRASGRPRNITCGSLWQYVTPSEYSISGQNCNWFNVAPTEGHRSQNCLRVCIFLLRAVLKWPPWVSSDLFIGKLPSSGVFRLNGTHILILVNIPKLSLPNRIALLPGENAKHAPQHWVCILVNLLVEKPQDEFFKEGFPPRCPLETSFLHELCH